MLRGEHHVLHPGILCRQRPLFGFKLRWIEGLLQIFVLFLIFHIIGITPFAPGFVFGAYGPRFHDAPLTVWAPVHQQSELDALPFLELLQGQRIRLRVILLNL